MLLVIAAEGVSLGRPPTEAFLGQADFGIQYVNVLFAVSWLFQTALTTSRPLGWEIYLLLIVHPFCSSLRVLLLFCLSSTLMVQLWNSIVSDT